MTTKILFVIGLMLVILLALLALPSQYAPAASLPQSTHRALKGLKLDPSILADIDQELKVPGKWTAGARKEGKLKIRSSPWTTQEQRDLFAPFKERYPFIDIEFTGANQNDRTIKTLVAYKSGRVLADVMTSIGGFYSEYRKADALQKVDDLPNWKKVPEGARDPEGYWVGWNIRHWCMSYNTRLVKKDELPKKWEDLLEIPVWGKGNLALGNRPQLWALMVWGVKGEKWTKEFLTRLFAELKPQLRKEGMNAMVQLVAASEFYAAVPSNKARTVRLIARGAPIGFTCPEPVPVSSEDLVILRRSPNLNAARIFSNWMLSREGQLASSFARRTTPVHADLQLEELIPFSDQIVGKQVGFRNPELEMKIMPKLSKFWNKLWLSQGRRR